MSARVPGARPLPRWRSALLILGFALLPFLLLVAARSAEPALGWPHLSRLVLAVYFVGIAALVLRRADCWMWATFLSATVAHTLLWRIADDSGWPVRYDYVVGLDRTLWAGVLPTHWLQAHMPAPGVVERVLFAVYATFYGIPFLALTLLRSAGYERARRYAIASFLAMGLALIAFTLLPTAPPWMAAREGIVEPVERVVARLAFNASTTASATYDAVGNNEVAAMPSLHMAVAVLCAIALARAYRRVRAAAWLAWGYGALMGLALVYLGEHYLVDVVAGAALGAASFALAGVLVRRFGPLVPVHPSAHPAAGAGPVEATPSRPAPSPPVPPVTARSEASAVEVAEP